MALSFGSSSDRRIFAYVVLGLAMGYLLPFSNEWFNALESFKSYAPWLISFGLFVVLMQLKDSDV